MKNEILNEVREFWDRRPCNIKHSGLPVGSVDYWREVEDRKYFVEPHIPRFADFAAWTGKRVLELGCGIGTDAVNFARRGAIYTGVDLSMRSIEMCRQRFDLHDLKGEFFCGDMEGLRDTLPDGRFDLIYSFGALHHTPDPSRAISEIIQFMDRDSLLKVMLYSRNSWKYAMIQRGVDRFEAQAGCPVAFVYDEAETRKLLRDLEIVDMQCAHIFPFQIEPYKEYRYVKEPWFECMPAQVMQALEASFGWHRLITARLR